MLFPGLITNQEYQIRILHVPTGHAVSFPGWVTQFSDQYQSLWNSTPTYGRMDPLATFQRTTRTIALSFDVVAASVVEARVNLEKISKLIRFLYPTYTGNTRDQQNTLSGGPLLGLKWTNIASGKGLASGGQSMLYGYVAGITYAPNVQDGAFLADPGLITPNQKATEVAESATTELSKEMAKAVSDNQRSSIRSYLPKTVNISLNFTVLHTHLMGWSDGEFGGNEETDLSFPYMPSVSIDPAAGVAPGDPGESLPTENKAAEEEALE